MIRIVEIPEMIQEILEWTGPALALVGGIIVGMGLASYTSNAMISMILAAVEPFFGLLWLFIAVKQ